MENDRNNRNDDWKEWPIENLESIKIFSLNGYQTQARFCQVYDGDTLKAVFPFQGTLTKWTCRLLGIDTPEMKTKNENEKKLAIIARDELKKLVCCVREIRCHEFDKYGRLLITILLEDNDNVSDYLIRNGFGKSYDGGHKDN